MWVIQRIDTNKYLAAFDEYGSSYTNKLENALVFPSKEKALKELCVDSERIISVESIFTRNK